jgi:RHS repeat-associated protein
MLYQSLRRPVGCNGTTFAYDTAGRLAQTETFTGCTIATGDSTYGTAWSSCSGHSTPKVYSYDNEGNRISQGGTYDIGNRVLSNSYFAYTHDLDGNITREYNLSTGADYQYTWSSDGRLTDVSYRPSYSDSAASVHYNYNAYGQPSLRSIGSSVANRVWLYDRGQLLGEFDAGNGNQRVAEYVYNEGADDPYGVIFGATTPTRIDYLESDESGNVLGAHEETTVTMTVNYDDWGVPSISSGTRVGDVLWKGLHRDEYTGLYYARARWYDPVLGSFVSEDPAGFAGGVNPYTFADDDPINGSDPTGMFAGSIMNAYNSCGIYCEFAGDLYHNRGPSKVPHAPPLRGVNPGNAHPPSYTFTQGLSCTVGYVSTNVYFARSGIHSESNQVTPVSGMPDLGCSSDTYLIFGGGDLPNDAAANFGGKHHGVSVHFDTDFPFIQALGYHVGLSTADDLGLSISTPPFNIGPPASFQCVKSGVGCSTH